MKHLSISFAALALHAGCSTGTTSDAEVAEFTRIEFASTKATAAERDACLAAGGEIIKTGRLQAEHCVQPYPDAGKVCSDEADCLGWCILEESVSEPVPGTDATGVCQPTTDSFGCTTLVKGGKIEGTICVD